MALTYIPRGSDRYLHARPLHLKLVGNFNPFSCSVTSTPSYADEGGNHSEVLEGQKEEHDIGVINHVECLFDRTVLPFSALI